ncbi:lamin tail domain-containing protein [Pontiellaceae bacterium B12227]|nr:lamin tail domain-containing protein [Pontiellaceae bacterium B12227]
MKAKLFLALQSIVVLSLFAPRVEAGDLLPSNARFVEVMKHDLSNTMLHIGEIEVFSFGTVPDELDADGTSQNDLVQAGSASAQVPPTTQQRQHGAESSVYDGDLEIYGDVWTTRAGLSTESRFMLDLGASYDLDLVRVWGRLDQCCFERLEDFSVTLYADNGFGQPGEVVSTVRYRSVAPASADGPVELSLAVVSPTLDYFHADHETIAPAESVTFSWKVNPAFTSVSMDNGIGDVTAQTAGNGLGSYTLTPGPTANTTYTMTVVRPSETKQAPRLISVSDQPLIRAFNSSHSLVEPGSPVQLSWDVANVVSVDLNGTDVSGTTSVTVNPQTSTQYTLTAVNLNGSVNAVRSVTVVAPGEAIISEFMADNDGSYLDEDLDASDWIELNNPTAVAANLNGYYLTDDPLNLMKWQLPDVTLNPGSFLIVFASGKDRAVAGSVLHANYSLKAGGEYLALVKPDGTTVVSEFGSEFVGQKNGISYGYGSGLTELGYLLVPTPGSENEESYLGFVKDTSFDVDRGFYDAPISVTITTPTDGAQVRYTLDGTEPTASSGYVWNSPIPIDRTTILRAAAFKPNYAPTDVDTHTYIFRSDVIASEVMDSSITQDPVYGPKMADSLVAIPTISLVSQGDIMRSEQPCSVELIGFESGNTQEDCGMARFGNYVTNFEKRNMRLYFRSDYGASKLNYPLFAGYEHGVQPVQKFDRLDLRTGGHDMWQRGFYMANRFVDDTLLEMGHLCTHGRYVHVYLNGTYWGQYHLRERWDAAMSAEYLGGEKEDYESIAANRGGGAYSPGTVYDGDGSAWENVKALASDFYAVSPFLNVTNYTDFLLVTFGGAAELETRTVGPVAAGSGFKFQMNDADGFLRNAVSHDNEDVLDGVDGTYAQLLEENHPDFKMLIADRIHKNFFNGGAFTPARNTARLNEWGDVLETSIIAEIARWKNMKIGESPSGYNLSTPDVWTIKKNNYISSQIPQITDQVVERCRQAGLYPSLAAPVFSQHGGEVPEGFQLAMNEPATVYYTLDGSDPRLPGGGISPAALTLSTASGETLIQKGAVWNYLDDGSDQGTAWSESGFNDSGWASGPGELGYGDGGEATVVGYGPDSENKYITTYFRHTIPAVKDAAAISSLTLNLRVDDGAVVYINGSEAARTRILPGSVSYLSPADSVAGGAGETTYYPFDINPSPLVNGDNVIAVEVHQYSGTSSDMSFDMELFAHRFGSGGGGGGSDIILDEDTVVKARSWDGATWSALTEAAFVIEGREAAAIDNLVMSEIHYNPDGSDDYEFIEFHNPSNKRVDLSGVSITAGIHHTFAPGTSIAPNGYGVVVRNADRFESRYQDPVSPWYFPEIHVLGQWIPSEKLDNGGESLMLFASNNVQIMDFSYDDGGFWPSRADGGGSSLELNTPLAAPGTQPEKNDYLGNESSWRSSREYHGSPGRDGMSAAVVINEILSHSDLGEDWIELYNAGASAVNIGGWHLSDSATNLTRYTIPGGTQIPGNSYLTFTETQLGFAFSELGDDATLSVISGTNLLSYIDSVDFGAAAQEVPFGRYERSDGGVDFPSLRSQTPAEENTYPLVGPMVISEIMVNPTNGPEYVELVNITDQPVKLYDATNPTSTWKISSAVEYEFPENQVVPPHGIVLLSGMSETALRAALPALPAKVQVFGPWTGLLDNQGESVKLYRPGTIEPTGFVPFILTDRVTYKKKAPWPLILDGQGHSLERIVLHHYGNDPANWSASATTGGSPGRVNHTDSDGDGLTDAQEIALGTDPDDPESRFGIDGTLPTSGKIQIAWPSATGVLYKVWKSQDLVNWTVARNWTNALTPPLDTLEVDLTPSNGFFTVEAEIQ